MKIEENFNLRSYNTFGLEVRCRYFAGSEKETDFLDLAASYRLEPEKILLLGGGSNFLFTGDFGGTVLYPLMKGIEVVDEDTSCVWLRVGAGEKWDDFVAWAVGQGYGGVENLSLIPGHVGATPVQNIGAYGVEAGEVIERVEAIDLEKAEKINIDAASCHFAYRDSVFKGSCKNRYMITYVTFRLKKQPVFRLEYGSIKNELEKLGGEVSLHAIREAVIRIRQSKLPDVEVLPNAGSFFKNPMLSTRLAEQLKKEYPDMPVYEAGEDRVKLAAGWLIEQAGWKGRTWGKAGVHDRQALVLVNRGGASGIEIAQLANEIKKSVFLKFGVFIEPEVNII